MVSKRSRGRIGFFVALLVLLAPAVVLPAQENVAHVIITDSDSERFAQALYLSSAVAFSNVNLSSNRVETDESGELDDLARIGTETGSELVFVIRAVTIRDSLDIDFILLRAGRPNPIAYREQRFPIDSNLDREIGQFTATLLETHNIHGTDGQEASIEGAGPQAASGSEEPDAISSDQAVRPQGPSVPAGGRRPLVAGYLAQDWMAYARLGGTIASGAPSLALPASFVLSAAMLYRMPVLGRRLVVGPRVGLLSSHIVWPGEVQDTTVFTFGPELRAFFGTLGPVIVEASGTGGAAVVWSSELLHGAYAIGAGFLGVAGRLSLSITTRIRAGAQVDWLWVFSTDASFATMEPSLVVSWSLE